MGSSRGKVVAFRSFAVGVLLLGASLLAFLRPLLEMWHIHRLGSRDVETRRDAASQLLDSGSPRAVERLLAELGAEMRQVPGFAHDMELRLLLDRKTTAVIPRKVMISEAAKVLSKVTGVEISLADSLRSSLRAVDWPGDRGLSLRELLGRGLNEMAADYNFAVVPGGLLLGKRYELLAAGLPNEPCGESFQELPLCRFFAGAGERAVPLLRSGLRHDDPYVRAGAATALGHSGAAPEGFLPALVRLLRDGVVDACAAEALGNLGARAKVAVEPLKEYLLSRHREEGARLAAATAWSKIEGRRPRTIPRRPSR